MRLKARQPYEIGGASYPEHIGIAPLHSHRTIRSMGAGSPIGARKQQKTHVLSPPGGHHVARAVGTGAPIGCSL